MQFKIKKFNSNFFAYLLLALILLGAGSFAGLRYYQNQKTVKQVLVAQAPKDIFLAFTDEVYDTIQQNYWQKISDADLTNLYFLAAEKIASSTPTVLETKDKVGLEKMLGAKLVKLSLKEKQDFIAQINSIVLANLQPFGRSALYTQASAQALNNEVNNVDTSTNLYAALGVNKNASQQEINQAYQQKSAELKKQNTPQAKQQLAQVERADEALKTPERKQAYDQTGAEPAANYREISNNIYYIQVGRFSPTLLQDLQKPPAVPPKPQQL